jgi:hypothetical protein
MFILILMLIPILLLRYTDTDFMTNNGEERGRSQNQSTVQEDHIHSRGNLKYNQQAANASSTDQEDCLTVTKHPTVTVVRCMTSRR